MALVLANRVQETGTANTTVSFTLTGAVGSFQSFAAVGNTNTTFYAATDASGNWEVGLGTYSTTGPTLTRTTVYASSNSGSAVTFSGTCNIFVTYPSGRSVNLDANGVATIGEVLGYSDTGIIGSFASTVAGYNQVIIQNKSAATNASTNFNVSNNTATSGTGFAELGINSSTFSGTGSFNIAGAAYLASASTDLTIGTYGAYNLHFVTNSSTTDAMTIFNSGGVSLGGQPDPGLGTLYANNVYIGFNSITAAAGTTVLTNSSAGYQQVVGTNTQTIQLPNATTLFKGLAYTIANNSTGSVTIKDSASTTLDTIVTGGTSLLVLTANGTSAGTWIAYSYVPSSYDFSTATANFGTATITNATYQGNTIASGYGGTGLTTFAAANNALYSTSGSALAAGTLPVAAGGTGQTSYTDGQLLIGNTTGNTLAKTTLTAGAGVSVTNGAGSITVANTGVTSITGTASQVTASASTGGVTLSLPATINVNTSGNAANVTGTVAVGNGGTGLTSIPANGALNIGNGTGFTRTTLTAGTAIGVANGVGSITISNNGVTSLTTSSGLSANTSATGAVSVTNTGVTSNVAGTGISVSGATGAVTITNSGVTSLTTSSGLSTNTSATGAVSVTNTGVTSIVAGTGISVSGATGAVTVNSTATGATITGTTTSATYYVVGTTSTSGSLTTASISNTNVVSYNASTGALSAVSHVSSSDESLKTNWRDVVPDFVEQLAGVKNGVFDRIESGNTEVGVGAQSLQKVLAEAVVSGEDGLLSVNYGGAALVAAIKLAERVVALEARLAALEK